MPKRWCIEVYPRAMSAPIDSAFAPPAQGWHPVSPKLATARRIQVSLVLAVFAAISVVLIVTGTSAGENRGIELIGAAMLVIVVVLLIWSWWLIGRQVRAMGYAERENDLLVVRGIMFRHLTIVPYGRMQMVDVNAGPIDRALGIATVQLHTAAATTDAQINGLTAADAAGLRDRLAARGETRSAGL